MKHKTTEEEKRDNILVKNLQPFVKAAEGLSQNKQLDIILPCIRNAMDEYKNSQPSELNNEVINLLERAKSFLPLYIPTKAHYEHNKLSLDIGIFLSSLSNNNP